MADTLRKFLFDLNVDDGLAAVGYSTADIPALVKGTLPQVRFSVIPMEDIKMTLLAHTLQTYKVYSGFPLLERNWNNANFIFVTCPIHIPVI